MVACLWATTGCADEAGATVPKPPSEERRQDSQEQRPAQSQKTAAARDERPATRRARQQAAKLTPRSPPPEFRGPDVTLIASEERNVYEYRQNGQLRMIKVVPKFGKPYYLAPLDPTRGWGDLDQARTLVAEWVLIEF